MKNLLLMVIAMCAVLSMSAQGVTTSPATLITQTTATINGVLDPVGTPSNLLYNAKFQYGTDSTSLTDIAANPNSQTPTAGSTSADITGLSSGTKYYYRICADYIGGSYTSYFANFTTSSATIPTVVSSSTVSPITVDEGYLLTNSVSSDGGATITGYGICWSTAATPTVSDDSVYTQGVPSATFQGVASGLTAGTKYYVRAVATNAVGIGYGAVKEFKTKCNAPSSSAATDIAGVSFTANWSAPSGGSEIGNYSLDVATDAAFTSKVSGYNGLNVGTATSYSVTGLNPTTTYYYQIKAVNDGGANGADQVSAPSSYQTLTTLSAEPTLQANIDSMVSQAANELTIYFSNGNGSGRMIYARANSPIINDPQDGTDAFIANPNFGSGTDLGNGTYVLFYGAAKGSVTITNLDPVNDYNIKIVEYSGTGSNINYNLINDQSSSADDSNLPIELLSFTGESNNQKVYLKWESASELNNDFFLVERSSNGLDFEIFEKISGAGTSHSVHTYQAVDMSPVAKLMYYRLKQIDYDGSINILPTIHVSISIPSSIQINQTQITSGQIHITLTNGENDALLEIVNVTGQVVYQTQIEHKGEQSIEIPTSMIAKGIYMIRLSNNQQESIEKKIIF